MVVVVFCCCFFLLVFAYAACLFARSFIFLLLIKGLEKVNTSTFNRGKVFKSVKNSD